MLEQHDILLNMVLSDIMWEIWPLIGYGNVLSGTVVVLIYSKIN